MSGGRSLEASGQDAAEAGGPPGAAESAVGAASASAVPVPAGSVGSLWLPMEPELRRAAWGVAGLVLAYYAATMARDLSFYDSAELALVAVQGGLGHPLGQPVHTLLGWAITRVPGVPPLLALNFLSALATALAVVPASFLLARLWDADPPGSRWARRTVMAPAAVGIAWLHPALWENGTRVEVYALGLFFGAWAAAWIAALLAPPAPGGAAHRTGWFVGGLLLGLTGSVNGFQAACLGLALVPVLAAALRRGLRFRGAPGDPGAPRLDPRGALLLLGGGLAGLLPYGYVFAVAHRTDVFVWGAPTGGELLWRYLKGADFGANRQLGVSDFVAHLGEWLGWAVAHGYWLPMLLGLGVWIARGPRMGLGRAFVPVLLAAVLGVLAVNGIFFPDIADYQGYLSLPVGLLVGAALLWGARLGTRADPRLVRLLGAVVSGAVLWFVVSVPPSVWERSRHRDRLARTLAEGALRDAPAGAVVLADTDHWVFPLLYVQEAEGQRPDLVLLPLGLSGASWYWKHLYRRHPDLAPFALRGPGGRVGRIRRFLAANPGRPVVYEAFAHAVVFGRPGCPGRWLLRGPRGCRAEGAGGPDLLTRSLEQQVDALGPGAPTARRVIARVAFERAETLWRYGLPGPALRAARAGVYRSLRPSQADPPVAAAGRLGPAPLRPPCPRVLIGAEARNLWLAAEIHRRAGNAAAAARYLAAARRAGCP